MRIFISLNLDDLTRSRFVETGNNLKSSVEAVFPGSVRWERAENLHITLFFIGEISREQLDSIISRLEKARDNFRDKTISFKSGSISAFPNLKKPRVLFAGLTNADRTVYSLSDQIRKELFELGFKDEKPFHPHVTLGRVKKDKRINLSEIKTGKFNIEFTCTEFYLMESKMSSEGSNYKVLQKFIFSESRLTS